MKKLICLLLVIHFFVHVAAQLPALHIHFVSHNEPNENLQQPLNYAKAKNNVLHFAHLVDSANVKWNLQTSDGFVYGARQDANNTGTNVFQTLASAPYSDNIQIDPRNKNFPGRNIADQYFLLDSLGSNPSKTVGGFVYYVCPPNDLSLIDWWPYTDTVVGLHYNNHIKFDLLSGAGSLAPHCHDLNDFGIFKPDTTDNFYEHNPDRNVWCVGVGCAPVLDSLDDAQTIIDLIQGQVDSIQNGLWPSDKFYVTRIMTNQREYGPMFFSKLKIVIDSLTQIPSTQLKWTTIGETFNDFLDWRESSGNDYSQWLCGQDEVSISENVQHNSFIAFPNPVHDVVVLKFDDSNQHEIKIFNAIGAQLVTKKIRNQEVLQLAHLEAGIYFIRIDGIAVQKIVKE